MKELEALKQEQRQALKDMASEHDAKRKELDVAKRRVRRENSLLLLLPPLVPLVSSSSSSSSLYCFAAICQRWRLLARSALILAALSEFFCWWSFHLETAQILVRVCPAYLFDYVCSGNGPHFVCEAIGIAGPDGNAAPTLPCAI